MKKRFGEANSSTTAMKHEQKYLARFLQTMLKEVSIELTKWDIELGVFCDDRGNLTDEKSNIICLVNGSVVAINTKVYTQEYIEDIFGKRTNTNTIQVGDWLFMTNTPEIQRYCWNVDKQVLDYTVKNWGLCSTLPEGTISFFALDVDDNGRSECGNIAHDLYKNESWFADKDGKWCWVDNQLTVEQLDKMTRAVNMYSDMYDRCFTVKDPIQLKEPNINGDLDIIWTLVLR